MKLGLSKTARIMCSVLLGLCAFFIAAGWLVITWVYPFEPAPAYAVGLISGTLLSAFRVVLMEKSLNRAVDMGEYDKAKSYGALQVLLRNLITLGFFVLVFFFRQVFGMFGAIIGVLSLQLSGYLTGFILRKDSTKV